ncbi:MAG: Hsp20/alpha crystallin family protein [Candidatus Thermoplasmatota archaeon]|jgi:HSP20 family molecular chaperone IbpA|nr:Hsp20/alpha crystallin family protein [Candidatus Thermoplasmatota archaeon]MCL5988212.1 Hsp20/alpha crystallin family protein [Candidatus Thermoplasmatota archaeon]
MTTIYGPLKFMADEFMKNVDERSKEVMTLLYPPISMYESENHLVIEADIPGFDKKHINVRVNKRTVEISATRKSLEKDNVYIDQRPDKIFKTVRLPMEADEDSPFTAKYENGVLTINIPIKGFKSVKIE